MEKESSSTTRIKIEAPGALARAPGPAPDRAIKAIAFLAYALLLVGGAWVIYSRGRPPLPTAQPSSEAEMRTAQYLEAIRSQPLMLVAFLRRMPKGGDLHTHLSGAIYAESYVSWAKEKGLCLDVEQMEIYDCAVPGGHTGVTMKLEQALGDRSRNYYRELVNSLSMRNWAHSNKSGHDQFFDSFGKFGAATSGVWDRMLGEVVRRAADGGVSYLELMLTPADDRLDKALKEQSPTLNPGVDREGLRKAREALLSNESFMKSIKSSAEWLRDVLPRQMRQYLGCGGSPSKPCPDVEVRYIGQVKRKDPLGKCFAQMVAWCEMAQLDGSPVVGLNLVQEEDDPVALSNFGDQMSMLGFLHDQYGKDGKLHISLHAGELVPGLVPPEYLKDHIRRSIDQGHAERIGHGADVLYEDDALALLADMKRKDVAVEVCLSSNDLILGMRGEQHPLSTYLKHGVPVVLATDDEGVARSEMTFEYVKTVREHGVDYYGLKRMARSSLDYAFIEGKSLWRGRGVFERAAECANDRPDQEQVSGGCGQFLKDNPKANLQWKLERAFAAFERTAAGQPDAAPQ